MSNERFDDELLSTIIDGEADATTVASVQGNEAANQRLEDMRAAAGIVGEEPAPASAERRRQSIAAALAAAEPAPNVTSLTAEREARRPFPTRTILAVAAALLFFVVAVPLLVGLRPGGFDTATDVVDAAGDAAESSPLSADDAPAVVEEAVSGDDDELSLIHI